MVTRKYTMLTSRYQIPPKPILLLLALFLFVAVGVAGPIIGVAAYEPAAISYIVQGADTATMANAVNDVGGELTHELGIIDAIGAKLTSLQKRLAESGF